MFYILHGENELERTELVTDLKHKIGDETVRDLNVTTLDGRKTTLSEIQHAADAIPFLADKRLVVIEGLLTRLASRGKGKASDEGEDESAPSGTAKEFLNGLLAYLPKLPDSTRLVFLETQSIKPTHPVLKLAEKQSGKTVIEFPQPQMAELAQWIVKRAKKHGGEIDRVAANKLAAMIGGDLRRIDQELIKLITYVNAQRAVTEKDVTLLVADLGLSNIFDMVDALGKRDGKKASRELHHLLDQGENALGMLAMIVRQFRLLIQVKELSDRSLSPDAIAKELKLHPFVAKKIGEQARNFTLPQLETIYRKLLDIDVEIKTGQTSDVLALDLLVAGLAS